MIRSLARLTAAALIIVAAAVFAIGVSFERHSEAADAAEQPLATSSPTNQVPTTSVAPTSSSTAPTTHQSDQDGGGDADHDGGSDEDHHAVATTARATTAAPATTVTPGAVAAQGDGDADGGQDQDTSAGQAAEAVEHSELVFGVNLESTPWVTAAVVVSVLLAAAMLTLGMPWLAGVIALAMLAFAALDIREIVHQLGESRLDLVAVAILVALLHVLAAVTAGHVARTAHIQRDGTPANVA